MSNTAEKHSFQAEVGQLLDIVTHSLYTDKEIFVRELVSNAADALEKLRHLQLTEKEIFDDSLALEINITTDDTAGTITIQDFGIGMTRTELVENIGTIAHSGSKAFVEALKTAQERGEDTKAASLSLIGQFGVGFYSVFMVAETTSVYTHSWRSDGEHLLWTSTGKGSYEIVPTEGQRRGCKIVVKLKPEEKEFSQAERVKEILNRYSKFVPFPINLNGERINTVQALWLRSKNEIKDEEYTEFYKFQANAFDEPRLRLHFSADAPLAINALLFVPQENTERFGFGRVDPGVSLYCKKILIEAKPDYLLPEWLRFLKGVVDSADLPLNISRETMQDSALMQKLNKVITGRVLKLFEEEAEKRPDTYAEFYKNFGVYIKEGVATDYANRDKLAKLLRFESSLTEAGKTTSLAEYVTRLKEGTAEIYFLHGPSRAVIESGPYLEAFKARSIEVLYLYDAIDEYVMQHLGSFDGKKLISADSSDAKLEDVSKDSAGEALPEAEATGLCTWIKELLGERATSVKTSTRLVDSPAVALNSDRFLTPAMRKMMKSMRQDVSENPAVALELNAKHPLIKQLSALRSRDDALAKLVTEQLFDNALIAAGLVDDPRTMVNRVYSLLEKVSK
ncbi:MAG: molecular chaperone HtpG [Verrucomicrobiota bacterium]|nr:molecular chaperone HtpG [Verrucomicrobiota bacterium]